ncbi:hypothetical protein JW835_12425 [bacterium]|nr:hypothetical protein [bacterium]
MGETERKRIKNRETRSKKPEKEPKKDGKDLRQRKCMDYGEKITNNKILVINK